MTDPPRSGELDRVAVAVEKRAAAADGDESSDGGGDTVTLRVPHTDFGFRLNLPQRAGPSSPSSPGKESGTPSGASSPTPLADPPSPDAAGALPITGGAKLFENVTVCFADIVGYTAMSSKMDPLAVHRILNEIFSLMDDEASLHGVQKIKTIGDAYMAVAGLGSSTYDHAEQIIDFAVGCLRRLHEYNQKNQSNLQMRFGVNSGPVVGGYTGIIGSQFDVWGDTVNVASRMESASKPNRINVSGATYALIGELYRFEDRRQVNLKGKGWMWCYLLVDSPDPRAEVMAMRFAKLLNWRRSMDSLVAQLKVRTCIERWLTRVRERLAEKERVQYSEALPTPRTYRYASGAAPSGAALTDAARGRVSCPSVRCAGRRLGCSTPTRACRPTPYRVRTACPCPSSPPPACTRRPSCRACRCRR